jgi:glucokinase
MRLGFDLGGTNLAYGAVDAKGVLVEKGSVALSDKSGEAIADLMQRIYIELNERYNFEKVGIGVPGVVAQKEGIVVACVNLGWKMVPLVAMLKEKIHIPISVGNDANAACIAEVLFGGMAGYQDAILLTLGTGLGGGVISGGKLLLGHQGAGSEIGHMVIGSNDADCNCGRNGCLETFASATALIRKYNQLNPNSPVHEAKSVFDRLQNGDDHADATVEWFCDHFATGIVNLYNIFAPEVIALGGGVARAFEHFEARLNHVINTRVFSTDIEYAKIVEAVLGNDAGIIGAAYLDSFL